MNLFDVVVVQPILNLLMAIYAIIPGSDFGISVIIFTIITRLLLWPIIKKQLHQAKAIRKMQPELKKLRQKYKNDRQAQGLAMMELYKKHNISPFGSIGVLLIQLPILLAIYRVVQIFVMHRDDIVRYTYSFMDNLPTVKALVENPDNFNQNFLGVIDLTEHAISSNGTSIGLIFLALLAAVLQFFISKQMSPNSDDKKRLRDVLAEAGEGKDTDQSEVNAIMMRKMMKIMPVMLFVIMISLPGALALYMATSNAVAYLQNKVILKKDQDEMQEVAGKPSDKPTKPSAKQRASKATEAKVTRITAKDK